MSTIKPGPKKGEPKEATTIYLPKELLNISRYYAKTFKDMTFTAFVEYLIRKELKPTKKQLEDAVKTASDI
jgi:hypothetical protein